MGLFNDFEERSNKEIMTKEYYNLVSWLHEHDLTAEEIKELLPNIYKRIIHCIELMDDYFNNNNLDSFIKIVKEIKKLYTDSLEFSNKEV